MTDLDVYTAFNNQLGFEGALRVDVVALPHSTDTDYYEHLDDLNLRVLSAIETNSERRPELLDEDAPMVRELARLEARIEVLTELLSRTLLPETKLPPARQVCLNAYGIQGAGSVTLAPGTPVLVRIHFDACRALPLELSGRVHDPDNDFIAFEQLGSKVCEGLERLVFRLHRRSIAGARIRTNDET